MKQAEKNDYDDDFDAESPVKNSRSAAAQPTVVSPTTWFNRGVDMLETPEKEESFEEDKGTKYNAERCFVKALEGDSKLVPAWYNLCYLLLKKDKGASVKVGGTAVSPRDCCVHALESDANHHPSWCALAQLLGSSRDTVLVGGETYDAKRCYERMLSLQPQDAAAWHNLALTLSEKSGEASATVSGESYDAKRFLREVAGAREGQQQCVVQPSPAVGERCIDRSGWTTIRRGGVLRRGAHSEA